MLFIISIFWFYNITNANNIEYSWSGVIVIESNEWINKPIFDEETLLEYYAYKSTIMFLILFFMFFKRLLDRKNNKII